MKECEAMKVRTRSSTNWMQLPYLPVLSPYLYRHTCRCLREQVGGGMVI
ncbi:hypothetical protein V1290_002856 [Bradyrhizobium sp. AZCC 1578]